MSFSSGVNPRIGAVIAIVACLAALIVGDWQRDRVADARYAATDVLPMPAASSDDALGSTWFCPGGLVSSDGALEHSVVVTNPGDAVTGTMTIFPAVPDGDGATLNGPTAVELVAVAATSQRRIALSTLVLDLDPLYDGASEVFAAAVLEFSEPGVVVEHVIQSAEGVDAGPCASHASSEWYFATGTTTVGVREMLAILNPFPTTAVLDITFSTDDAGIRTPGAYDGLVVAPRSLMVLDIGQENTVRAQSSMSVRLRSGRVVAERLQFFSNEDGPRGFSTALGVSQPSIQWFVPGGRSIPGAGESYVIYNPTGDDADVEIVVRPVRASASETAPAPFPLSVAGGERVMVVINETDTHPTAELAVSFEDRLRDDSEFWVLVQSFNDVPVVVERVVTVADTDQTGILMGPGAPLASTRQWLSLPIEFGATSPSVAVLNPAPDTIARLKVSAFVTDEVVEVTGLEIAPGERISADLSASLPAGTVALLFESSTPVVSEAIVATAFGTLSSVGVPVADSVADPRLIADFGG